MNEREVGKVGTGNKETYPVIPSLLNVALKDGRKQLF